MSIKVGDVLFLDTNVLLTAADDFAPFPEVGTVSISDALRALAALALPE